MSPRRKNAKHSRNQPGSFTRDAAARQPEPRVGRMQSLTRYITMVFLSLCLSSGLYTLTTEYIVHQPNIGNKTVDSYYEVCGLVAWKGAELGIAWIMRFDVCDVLSFTFLTHLPTFALLFWFYKVAPSTILGSYAIVVFSSVVPFFLFRNRALVVGKQPTPSVLQDRVATIYTILTAAAIFSLALYASYATWLPTQLVIHFAKIPDISAAHAGPAGWPILFLTLLPAGWASRDFLFGGWARATQTRAAEETHDKVISREGDYLACILYRKTWGVLNAGMRTLLSRTFLLATMMLANTIVQVTGTINGTSVRGAIVWGAVWTAGCLATGAVFVWVGAVDGTA